MTLVILAAGLGSRYGGLKQIDPITTHGEFIIDYSIYDAIEAGFDRVVFLIKKENLDAFKETIADRIAPFTKIDFAFQSLDMIPEGFEVPAERTKPWGTAHAVLCCREVVGNDNFAVINADDFYGREAFVEMAKVLSGDRTSRYVMAGYILDNTLTDNGSVARGVCKTENGKLVSIEEHTKIYRDGEKVFCACREDVHPIDRYSPVSMNFFGFAPDVFDIFEREFKKFLTEKKGELKAEFFIPLALSGAMASGECTVDVFPTDAKWFGVTYAADKPGVVQKIKEMTENGTYPDGLWINR
ncbi:MAG: nucleotidyltransferase [Clostridia bacterium]|nr:nucleotidyltransferase [Clostridia bacterium]